MAKQTKHTKNISSPTRPELEKKLRKDERTLRKRLQEAREVQAEALERFKRAEARLEKRTAQTQNLEAHLAHVQQQLGILQIPQVSTVQSAELSLIPTDEDTQATEPLSEIMQIQPTDEEQPDSAPTFAEVHDQIDQFGEALPVDVETPVILATEQDISGEVAEITEAVEAVEIDQLASEDVHMNVEEALSVTTAIVSPSEASGLAKIARTVAETAERAARIAIERAVEVAARIEQMSSGRHLIQELEQTQSEADRASAIAQQAQRAAEEAERLEAEATMQASATPDTEISPSDSEEAMQEEAAEELVLSTLEEIARTETIQEEMVRDEMALAEQEAIADVEEITQEIASRAENLQEIHLPLPNRVEEIEDIEEEEAMVEAITAKLIADAAAAAAAEAEALAEASSSRTREARRLAAEADRVLDNVYAAFLDGSMPEEEAQARLLHAERQSTRAHAMLADAEAAEEEAINAARNAEADAEVAESMAFASNDIAEQQFNANASDDIAEQQFDANARDNIAEEQFDANVSDVIAKQQSDTNVVPALTDENVSSDNSDQPDIGGDVNKANSTNDASNTSNTNNTNNMDTTVKMRKIYPRQPM